MSSDFNYFAAAARGDIPDEEGDLVVQSGREAGLAAKIDAAEQALESAASDFERLQIRDIGAAAAAAAEILGRRDIQTKASILVCDAERAIWKANQQPAKPGPKTGNSCFPEVGIPRKLVQNIRAAHSKVDDDDYEEKKEEARQLCEPLSRKAIKLAAKAAVPGTGQEDWHTPDLYLEAARRAMGSIDFDPASSAAAQKRVKAKEYCTRERSGLERDWKGNVWINPPYSAVVIPLFADKLLGELDAGRVDQCCWLSNASLDTRWGQRLSKAAQGLALVRGRVKFIAPDGKEQQSNAWMTVVLYFGGDVARFADAFAGLGDVWQRS